MSDPLWKVAFPILLLSLIALLVVLVLSPEPIHKKSNHLITRAEFDAVQRKIWENPDDPHHPDAYLAGPGRDIASRRIRELFSDVGIDTIQHARTVTIWNVVNDGYLNRPPGVDGYQDDYRKTSKLAEITDGEKVQEIASTLLNPKFYFQSIDGYPMAVTCLEFECNGTRVDIMVDPSCDNLDIDLLKNGRLVHQASSYHLKARQSDRDLFDLLPILSTATPAPAAR